MCVWVLCSSTIQVTLHLKPITKDKKQNSVNIRSIPHKQTVELKYDQFTTVLQALQQIAPMFGEQNSRKPEECELFLCRKEANAEGLWLHPRRTLISYAIQPEVCHHHYTIPNAHYITKATLCITVTTTRLALSHPITMIINIIAITTIIITITTIITSSLSQHTLVAAIHFT